MNLDPTSAAQLVRDHMRHQKPSPVERRARRVAMVQGAALAILVIALLQCAIAVMWS